MIALLQSSGSARPRQILSMVCNNPCLVLNLVRPCSEEYYAVSSGRWNDRLSSGPESTQILSIDQCIDFHCDPKLESWWWSSYYCCGACSCGRFFVIETPPYKDNALIHPIPGPTDAKVYHTVKEGRLPKVKPADAILRTALQRKMEHQVNGISTPLSGRRDLVGSI